MNFLKKEEKYCCFEKSKLCLLRVMLLISKSAKGCGVLLPDLLIGPSSASLLQFQKIHAIENDAEGAVVNFFSVLRKKLVLNKKYEQNFKKV